MPACPIPRGRSWCGPSEAWATPCVAATIHARHLSQACAAGKRKRCNPDHAVVYSTASTGHMCWRAGKRAPRGRDKAAVRALNGERSSGGAQVFDTAVQPPARVDDRGSERSRFEAVRRQSEALAAKLSPEDQAIQSMPDASPTKWHLAHTSWFFETFILQPLDPSYRVFDPAFAYLFNSYYEARSEEHTSELQ